MRRGYLEIQGELNEKTKPIIVRLKEEGVARTQWRRTKTLRAWSADYICRYEVFTVADRALLECSARARTDTTSLA
jgi:hypothetical protein